MPETRTNSTSSKLKITVKALVHHALSDKSLWPLFAANAVAVIFAVIQRWDLMTMLWIYWAQNIIIGFFHFLRILSLKNFSTAGTRVNGQPVQATPALKRTTAWFFLFHYGFFHLVYALFLTGGFLPATLSPQAVFSPTDYLLLGVSVSVFFLNNLFSFFSNRKQDLNSKPNIGLLMFFPYARILPMHLTIILGSGLLLGLGETGFLPAILLFLLLKTLADLIMQTLERKKMDLHNAV